MEFLFACPYPLRATPLPQHTNTPAKHDACKRIAGLQLKHPQTHFYCLLSFAYEARGFPYPYDIEQNYCPNILQM